MRYFLSVVVLFCLFLITPIDASEEIKRIDSMVNDIVELRHTYEKKLSEEQEKNLLLQKEKDALENKISSLENQIKNLKNSKKTSYQHFKAAAFFLRENADIYASALGDKVIAQWEKGRSFTSTVKSDKRIKITGYFVNKVWRKAEKDMWIELNKIDKKRLKD